ncbi:unnamed protein product [Ectocarpus fasciculatus]
MLAFARERAAFALPLSVTAFLQDAEEWYRRPSWRAGEREDSVGVQGGECEVALSSISSAVAVGAGCLWLTNIAGRGRRRDWLFLCKERRSNDRKKQPRATRTCHQS